MLRLSRPFNLYMPPSAARVLVRQERRRWPWWCLVVFDQVIVR